MVSNEIEEESVAKVALAFSDFNDAPVVPTSFKYKVQDVRSGTVMKVMTTLSPGAATYTLFLESAVNVIVNSGRDYEWRQLQIEWFNGATKMGTKRHYYKVVNSSMVPLA